MTIRIPAVFIQISAILLLSYVHICVAQSHAISTENPAQDDPANTDTTLVYPSDDFGLFFQIGLRSSKCESYMPFLVNIGAQWKVDIVKLHEDQRVFLRVGGSWGSLPMTELGAGWHYSRNRYVSVSYAFLASPDCARHNMGSTKPKETTKSMMLTIGKGRSGFLFEFNLFVFFEKERYLTDTFDALGNFITRDVSSVPVAFSLRFGYVF